MSYSSRFQWGGRGSGSARRACDGDGDGLDEGASDYAAVGSTAQACRTTPLLSLGSSLAPTRARRFASPAAPSEGSSDS